MCRFVIVLLFSMSAIVFHAMESMENIQENMKALELDEHKQEQNKVSAGKELLVNILAEHAQKPGMLEKKLKDFPEKLCRELYEYSTYPVLRDDLLCLLDINGDQAITKCTLNAIEMHSFLCKKIVWNVAGDDSSVLYYGNFSPDGQYIAIHSIGVYICAADSGNLIAAIKSPIDDFCWDNDNNVLYSENRELKKYNIKEQQSYNVASNVSSVKSYLGGTNTVLVQASGTYDYNIIDKVNGDVIKTIPRPFSGKGPVYYAAHSKDLHDERLATVSYDADDLDWVYIWDLTTPSPTIIAAYNISAVSALCFDDTGNKIIAGTHTCDHSVYLLDVSQQRPVLLARYVLPDESSITKLWWHNNGIIARTRNGNVYCMRLLLAQKIKQYTEAKNRAI